MFLIFQLILYFQSFFKDYCYICVFIQLVIFDDFYENDSLSVNIFFPQN